MLKAGDKVKVKNIDKSIPPLEFIIDEIKEVSGSTMAEGPYGGFNVDLLELVTEQQYIIVPLKLSQEEYESIENLAAVNYSPQDCALYLSVEKELFMREYYIPTSLVRTHYDKGCLQANFEIDNKLLENAKSGNITAAQETKKAQEKRLWENHKSRILNEG